MDNDIQTTPLHEAVAKRDFALCRQLILEGADIDAKVGEGRAPLLDAAVSGQLDICQLLLDAGADVQTRNKLGIGPLADAAYKGYTEVCRLLISHGASLTAEDDMGRVPLHWAVIGQSKAACEVLVSAGADPSFCPSVPEQEYFTPLQWALTSKQFDIAALFIERYGADLNQVAGDGRNLEQLAGTKEWREHKAELFAANTAFAVRTSVGSAESGQSGSANRIFNLEPI